jgi:hypothetical protein
LAAIQLTDRKKLLKKPVPLIGVMGRNPLFDGLPSRAHAHTFCQLPTGEPEKSLNDCCRLSVFLLGVFCGEENLKLKRLAAVVSCWRRGVSFPATIPNILSVRKYYLMHNPKTVKTPSSLRI